MATRAPYGMEMTDDCVTCPMRKDGFFCQMSAATLADFQKMEIYQHVSRRGCLVCRKRGTARSVHALQGSCETEHGLARGKNRNRARG